MPATVSRTILDLSIRHKIGLAGYEAWVVRKVIGLLNSSDADLERQISMAWERSAPQDTRERLAAIRKELLAVNGEAYRRMGYFLTKEMRDLVTDEVAALADIVEGALPFKFSATRPSAALLHALVTEDPLHGRLLGPHIDNLAGNRAAALLEQLKIGTLQGESWGSLLKRVRGTAAGGYRDGVLETIGRRQAETLTRTAVQHFSEAARDRLIQENEDLFQGVMWVNTLDLRTCPRCQVRGGLVWDLEYKPVGHSLEWLGGPGRLHFLDRCSSIPVLRDVEDLEAAGIAPRNLRPGERAAMEGPVPVTHEYEDWLREQPDDFQADALESVARAAEFRSGKSLSEVWDMRFDRRTPQAPTRASRIQALDATDLAAQAARSELTAQRVKGMADLVAAGGASEADLAALQALDAPAAAAALRQGTTAVEAEVFSRSVNLNIPEMKSWLDLESRPAWKAALEERLAFREGAANALAADIRAAAEWATPDQFDEIAALDPGLALKLRMESRAAAKTKLPDLLTRDVPSLGKLRQELKKTGPGTAYEEVVAQAHEARALEAKVLSAELLKNPYAIAPGDVAKLKSIDPWAVGEVEDWAQNGVLKAVQSTEKANLLTALEDFDGVQHLPADSYYRKAVEAAVAVKQKRLVELVTALDSSPTQADLAELLKLHPEAGKAQKKKITNRAWNKSETILKQVKSGKVTLEQAHAQLAAFEADGSFTAAPLAKKLATYEDELKKLAAGITPSGEKKTIPGTGSAGPKPVEVLDGSAWSQVGPQAGSNLGGLYDGPHGKFYVKFPKADVQGLDRLREEIAASRLYQAAGVKVPDIHLVDFGDGRMGIASKIVTGAEKVTGEALAKAVDVRVGFVTDAWLANWDVAGAGFDNILVDAEGAAFRIDLGGSLRFRAQGSAKGSFFGDIVGELESLRNSGVNPNTAKVFGGFTGKQIAGQIASLEESMTDEIIRRTVFAVPGLREPEDLIRTLIARRQYLSGVRKQILEELEIGGGFFKASGADEVKKYWTEAAAKKSRSWVAGLNSAEKTAVQRYSDGMYSDLNRNLRAGAGVGAVPEDAHALEAALRRASLPQNTVVFRGCDAEFLRGATAGAEVTDWGFVSTSMNPSSAFSGIKLEIRIPAGRSGAAYIQPLSHFEGEFEVLLQRGSRFRVVSISPGRAVLEWLGGVP